MRLLHGLFMFCMGLLMCNCRAEEVKVGVDVAVVYSKGYAIELGGMEKLHSFDINKYGKIYAKLKAEGFVEKALEPQAITDQQILMVHSEKFLKSLDDAAMVADYLEAPQLKYLGKDILRDKVLQPFRLASGGTILAARQALKHKVAINIGGGYHHAMPDAGEGFCVFADMPIAIRQLQKEKLIKKAFVVDLDVHQGNGTAVCLANDPNTFTFSIHQGDIYPIPKAKSDKDVEIKAATNDHRYMDILEKYLPQLLDKEKPDIVFLQAGCDTYKDDPLASVAMTKKGIVERDFYVINLCVEMGIPVVMTTGGGYSKAAWEIQYESMANIIKKLKTQTQKKKVL